MRELPSCIIKKFYGFNIVRVELSKKLRQRFHPIDVIYKPVKKCDKINSFSVKLNMAFHSSFSEGAKIRHGTAWQCYFCSNYYGRKDKYDRLVENCTGCPSYVYNFDMQSLLTFEENLKYKGDILLVAYIDFEITAPTDDCLDPENRKMFAVSYVIISAFHPDLDIDRVIIERSSGHPREKLTSLIYLTREQLTFKDNNMLLQLRDCTLAVADKKNRIAISEMFTTELKFAADCLLKWFNKKFKSNNLQLSNNVKKKI